MKAGGVDTLSMRTPLLFLGCLLAIPAAAQAKPRTERATFAQMKQDAQDISGVLQAIEGCDFQITDTASGGIRLTMNDRAKGSVTVEVSPDSQITLDSSDEEREDGSFSKSYKVAGAGELDVVNANDAYLHAHLTGADGRTLSCEIDY